jgi:bacteriorhodopsin
MALAVLTVSTIAYFAMASNLGQTVVRTEFRTGPTRSIFVRVALPTMSSCMLIYVCSMYDIFSGSSTRPLFSSRCSL